MKKFLFFFCFVTINAIAAFSPLRAQNVSNNNKDGVYKVGKNAPQYVEGEVIIKFKDESGVSLRRNAKGKIISSAVTGIDAALQKAGLVEMQQLMPLTGAKKSTRKVKALDGNIVEDKDLSRLVVAKFDASKCNTMEVIEQLKAMDEVEYAEPNYIAYICSDGNDDDPSTYDDPMRSQQWGIDAINLPKLWALGKTETRRPVIAILDTGCDIEHPDLAANIWTNQQEVEGVEYIDDDNNNYFDDIHGYNFVSMNTDLTDRSGHGTHCAGIAAAVGNNSIGVVGANPDAIIMPIKVLADNGQGSVSKIVQGIDYAVANGADVLSMSFGFHSPSQSLYNAVTRAYINSVVSIAAAGNDGKNWHSDYDRLEVYPAGYDCVIGVMASGTASSLSGFSNCDFLCIWPYTHYQVLAPGVNIYSTFLGGLYKSLSGTSMATPLIAGAYSRILQYRGYDYARDYGLLGDFYYASHNKDQDGVYSILKPFDAFQMAQYCDDNRELCLNMGYRMEANDEDCDGTIDAGETVKVYPIIKSTRGKVTEATFTLKPIQPHDVSEIYDGMLEDSIYNIILDKTMSPEFYDIEQSEVDFGWQISTSGEMVGKNPFTIRLHDDAPNERNVVCVMYGMSGEVVDSAIVVFEVNNVGELSGVIDKDLILPGKKYVAKNCAILAGVTLTLSEGADFSVQPYTEFYNYGTIVVQKGATIRDDSYNHEVLIGGKGKIVLESGSKLYYERDDYGEVYESIYSPLPYGCISEHRIENLDIKPGAQLYLDGPSIDYVPWYITCVDMQVLFNVPLIGTKEDPIYIYCSNSTPVFWLNLPEKNVDHVKVIGDVELFTKSFTVCDTCKNHPESAYYEANIDATGTYYFQVLDAENSCDRITQWTAAGQREDVLYCPFCKTELYRGNRFNSDVLKKYPTLYSHYLVRNTNFGPFRSGGKNYDLGLPIARHCNIDCSESTVWDHVFFESGDLDWNDYGEAIRVVDIWGSDSYCIAENCNLKGITIKGNNNNLDFAIPSLEYRVTDTPPNEILVPYYVGSSSLDYINRNTKKSVWWPNVKYTGFASGADRPFASAPGMVWTVKVNGKDAHDDFDISDPVGLGDMDIEVWFNTPMDKSINPKITMGISAPFNKFVAPEGTWNSEGTIYSTRLTLDAKSATNGVNCIIISEAKDVDGIEIIKEANNHRFRVNVQAIEALSTDLVADAGVGKVTLEWSTDASSFVDILGYNVYRYQMVNNSGNNQMVPGDTIMINTNLVDSEEMKYVDYNVVPGTTYYYLVREIGTDMQEFDVSNVVSATPLKAGKGDSNGSMTVDVADVMTDIYYLTGQNPQPFIFEAADVNEDNAVNVLDVICTVNMIQENASAMGTDENEVAIYTIENGTLYVETPCALSGVQALVRGNKTTNTINIAENMNGFETVREWLDDEKYFFLGYSLSGRVLNPGKHALLHIGDAELSEVILSDTRGHNVIAISNDESTAIASVDRTDGTSYRVTDLMGRTIKPSEMQKGIYVVTILKNSQVHQSFKYLKK